MNNQPGKPTLAEGMRAAHPEVEPSRLLDERVRRMAAEADAGRAPMAKRRPVLRWTLAAVILGSLLASGVVFGPKLVLAAKLRRVSSNLLQAEGLHYRMLFFSRGRVNLVRDIWQRDGKWRLDVALPGRQLTQIKADGKFWTYWPEKARATFQPAARAEALTFSVEKISREIPQLLAAPEAKDLGSEIHQGRRLQRVAVPAQVEGFAFVKPEPGRAVLWIDRDEMLPVRIEQQVESAGTWVPLTRIEFDFRQPVSPDRFTIPKEGIRIYDLNSLGAQVGRRFIRPLAVRRFATRTIALRDVQINRDGDLFVLYTDGSTRDRSLPSFGHVSDDRNTVYTGTAGGIEPFMYHVQKEYSRGITVNGEVMQGFCNVPLQPGPYPRPRRLHVEIQFEELQGGKMKVRYARFTVPAPRPQSTVLPSYGSDLALLSLDGGDEMQFKLNREWGRRARLGNEENWHGLLQAADRAIRAGGTNIHTYLDRAKALTRLGRFPEARSSLQSARSADPNGWGEDQVVEAEKAVSAAEAASRH